MLELTNNSTNCQSFSWSSDQDTSTAWKSSSPVTDGKARRKIPDNTNRSRVPTIRKPLAGLYGINTPSTGRPTLSNSSSEPTLISIWDDLNSASRLEQRSTLIMQSSSESEKPAPITIPGLIRASNSGPLSSATLNTTSRFGTTFVDVLLENKRKNRQASLPPDVVDNKPNGQSALNHNDPLESPQLQDLDDFDMDVDNAYNEMFQELMEVDMDNRSLF
ncbi:hypothetical protein H0H87_010920 [Tephrocybe sp. NHM501043]|nr:hypothetical protein H0H87_010920 [Tephrocybe sp. NHM501043]